ncbi:MAG: 2-C-methyl-D-erythritol 2,4-cyclodiphosphate synthase [Pseudomonadota bacterium]
MNAARIGHGFDVHAYDKGDGFVLGGVFIPCSRSVVAHSDGDVLIHALCDAVLGALGRGDIGQWFPDTHAEHEGRDSREFLREIHACCQTDGYGLLNADITIIAQAPRLSPHLSAMKLNLSQDLNCEQSCLNIKSTTTEKLGYIGREEGIAVHAVVLLGKV